LSNFTVNPNWDQATLIFVESFGIQVGPLFRWAIYVIGFCI